MNLMPAAHADEGDNSQKRRKPIGSLHTRSSTEGPKRSGLPHPEQGDISKNASCILDTTHPVIYLHSPAISFIKRKGQSGTSFSWHPSEGG